MSEEAHLKGWYVARVVTLEGENRKLRNEVDELRKKLNRMSFYAPMAFAAGYYLACILWRVFK